MNKQVRSGLIFAVALVAVIFAISKFAGETSPWAQGGGALGLGADIELISPNDAGAGVPLERKLAVLEELGFTFTDAERSLVADYGVEDGGYADLLASLGLGNYDYDAWEWSPTSDQVFALDTEVYDVGNMYPLFFQGLLTISGLPITGVAQDDSRADWEEGTGILTVSLDYDGRPYSFDVVFNYDWLDCNVLKEVNAILAREGVEQRFYACWNNFQGMTIFYRDADWARQFEKKTGCRLFTEA